MYASTELTILSSWIALTACPNSLPDDPSANSSSRASCSAIWLGVFATTYYLAATNLVSGAEFWRLRAEGRESRRRVSAQ
jgi:hypothetical protein